MLLSRLYFEDLCRVYARSPQPLDRGPFQGQPGQYRREDFGNPSDRDVRNQIIDKLLWRIERARTDLRQWTVLAYYIDFVQNRMDGDSTRRRTLLAIIRQRLRLDNPAQQQAALQELRRRYNTFRNQVSPPSAVDHGLAGSHAGLRYGGRLRVFRLAIDLILSAIEAGGNRVNPDLSVQEALLLTFRSPRGEYTPPEAVVEGRRGALSAWNGLSLQQRAALRTSGNTALQTLDGWIAQDYQNAGIRP
jgi:hypothetical protein